MAAYNLEEDFLSAGTFAQWITSADMDEELVYQMTKALWHPGNRPVLAAAHPVAAGMSPDNALIDRSAPLHPGAARYYREIGVLADNAPEAQPVERSLPTPHPRP